MPINRSLSLPTTRFLGFRLAGEGFRAGCRTLGGSDEFRGGFYS
jgi:hypothetical protein